MCLRPTSPKDFLEYDKAVAVGKIVGSWGIRGEIKVELLTAHSSRFVPGSMLYLDGRAVIITHARNHKRGLVVKLDIINDRTKADSFRNKLLTVSEDDVGLLPEDSYYHFEIIDIAVWTDQGECLGHIKEIFSTGSNDVYVVNGIDGGEVLVPALKSVIQDVILDENRMVVTLPDVM